MMWLLVQRFIVIFFLAGLFSSYLSADASSARSVFIVVQKDLSPHLDKNIFNAWLRQLEREGWKTTVLEPEPHEVHTPHNLKAYLVEKGVNTKCAYAQASANTPVNGVILIGVFPKPHVDLSPGKTHLSSDLCFMDASDNVRLLERYGTSASIEVKPNETLDSFNTWVSRIEYFATGIEGSDEWIRESGNFINQYLAKNNDCRSSGFALSGCSMEVEVSGKKFVESKSLVGLTDYDKYIVEGMARSTGVTGEAFLDVFVKAQVEKKRLLHYFLGDGWECWQYRRFEPSFLRLMYDSYYAYPSLSRFPHPGKILLYCVLLPALSVTVPASALGGWAYPPARKYLGAAWGILAALAVVPLGRRSSHYYLPLRHYLPTLLGDGTLHKLF